jgi:hypothetical protein
MTGTDDCGVVVMLDMGALDLLVAERPPSARRKLKASLHECRVSSTRGRGEVRMEVAGLKYSYDAEI